jgi:hypothetical protein
MTTLVCQRVQRFSAGRGAAGHNQPASASGSRSATLRRAARRLITAPRSYACDGADVAAATVLPECAWRARLRAGPGSSPRLRLGFAPAPASAAGASCALRRAGIQEQSVDTPGDAVASSQMLVVAVMTELEYPADDHEQVLADLSVGTRASSTVTGRRRRSRGAPLLAQPRPRIFAWPRSTIAPCSVTSPASPLTLALPSSPARRRAPPAGRRYPSISARRGAMRKECSWEGASPRILRHLPYCWHERTLEGEDAP